MIFRPINLNSLLRFRYDVYAQRYCMSKLKLKHKTQEISSKTLEKCVCQLLQLNSPMKMKDELLLQEQHSASKTRQKSNLKAKFRSERHNRQTHHDTYKMPRLYRARLPAVNIDQIKTIHQAINKATSLIKAEQGNRPHTIWKFSSKLSSI